MKLVTLARITLNRLGSLSLEGGFQRSVSNGESQQKSFLCELNGDEPGDVLAKLKELAVQQGEVSSALASLSNSTPFGSAPGHYEFCEEVSPYGGTWDGRSYAECEVFPALKIEGRYFKLNEVT